MENNILDKLKCNIAFTESKLFHLKSLLDTKYINHIINEINLYYLNGDADIDKVDAMTFDAIYDATSCKHIFFYNVWFYRLSDDLDYIHITESISNTMYKLAHTITDHVFNSSAIKAKRFTVFFNRYEKQFLMDQFK